MLLVTSAVRTLLSISQNGINQITLKKQIGNHLNKDIINASISLSSFLFVDDVVTPPSRFIHSFTFYSAKQADYPKKALQDCMYNNGELGSHKWTG